MRFYFISIAALLLLTGCGSAPQATLAPKLSQYATAQQQCSDFLDGKSELTGEVEKECDLFLKRLNKNNEIASDLASGKLKKGEAKETKILYSRERNKLKLQYSKLSMSVQKATLAAIESDNVKAFEKGIAFPGNTFITPYYQYMKSKAPAFDNHQLYLDYKHRESEKLMLKAQHYFTQGKQKKALNTFEHAAEMGNPQAARKTALLYEKTAPEKALKWHLIAVDGGVNASYLNLGHLYDAKGKRKEALTWYLKAAEANNAKAQYKLYVIYANSDQAKALSWLKKSATNGYNHAQYQYALILMQEGKTSKSVDLLLQASQNNYPLASDYLGAYYYQHKLFDRAFKQLKQTESAESFYLRAKMLEKGAGTPQNYALAYTFYSRADALGKKDADKEMKRVDALLSKEQQRIAAEEKMNQDKRMASMVKQCGAIPKASSIKKRNKKFHIIGTASAPVGRRSFIIYGDDGEDYYLLRAKGIQEDDKVDISVMSTGSTATINSAEDEDAMDIYQFTFIKECVIEEEEQ